MNTRKHKSVRHSLTYLVLLFLVPFVFIIFYSARQERIEAYQNASDNAFRMASTLEQQQKFIESNTRQFLTVLSQLSELTALDTAKLNILFFKLLRQNPSYSSLLLVDIKGDLIASGNAGKRINVGDRKYFNDVLITRSFSVD